MPKKLALVKERPAPHPFAGLSTEAREWAEEVAELFELEGHHVKLLVGAAVAWDRAMEARASLDEKGLTYLDRFRQPKERPEVAVERNSLNTYRLMVRELGLDLPHPGENRPPRVGG